MVTESRARGGYAKGIECREALARAALQLVAERGPTAVSVAAVAETVGVTKGAAYWHFANKDALLAAATDRALDMWMADVLAGVLGVPTAAERVQWLISAHVAQLLRPRSAAAYLAKTVATGPAGRPVLRRWRGHIRQVLGLSLPGAHLSPQMAGRLTEAVVGALIGLGVVWDAERDRMGLQVAAAGLAQALAGKVSPDKTFLEPNPMVLI